MFTPSSNSSVIMFHAPPIVTRSLYANCREAMRQKEQQENGDELECPILFTPVTTEAVASKNVLSVAKFGQTGDIVGMNFVSASALTEWFKTRLTHPLTNQPLGINPLKKRAEYAAHLQHMSGLYSMEDGEPFDLTPAQVQELFPIFLKESTTFAARFPMEYAWMQCHLKMGDTGIHMTFKGTAGEQRTAAMVYLADKPVGTGVFRLSSIQSTKLVECFAISYVSSQRKLATAANGEMIVTKEAGIRNIAIGHIMGYGYTIMEACIGQILPDMNEQNVSNGVPLPTHDQVWPSLLDLLLYLRDYAINFSLVNMVMQQ